MLSTRCGSIFHPSIHAYLREACPNWWKPEQPEETKADSSQNPPTGQHVWTEDACCCLPASHSELLQRPNMQLKKLLQNVVFKLNFPQVASYSLLVKCVCSLFFPWMLNFVFLVLVFLQHLICGHWGFHQPGFPVHSAGVGDDSQRTFRPLWQAGSSKDTVTYLYM